MKTIWKFPFEVDDSIEIEMPEYAQILYVDVQNQKVNGRQPMSSHTKEVPCIWARVNTERPMVKRKFRISGTGHPMPDMPLQHIGSFKMAQDRLVFHLFEKL